MSLVPMSPVQISIDRSPRVSFDSVPEVCSVVEGCITCGDVAVPLTVITTDGSDARCRDDQGREEMVAVELIDPVVPGDRVLVHAGVAIEKLAGDGLPQPATGSGE